MIRLLWTMIRVKLHTLLRWHTAKVVVVRSQGYVRGVTAACSCGKQWEAWT